MQSQQYRTYDPVALMDNYRKQPSLVQRNDLVMHYSYIARSVAMQLRGIASNYAQLEDIVNQGMLTLIDCVEKYDGSRGVKFESYAFMRVKGAVIDFIRKQDWLPRRVRKTARDLEEARTALSNQMMREPTTKELADYMKLPEEALHRHYSEYSNSVMLSFESVIQNTMQQGTQEEQSIDENAMPEQLLFRQELRSELIEAIQTLTEKERTVISLYYYEHLKFKDISEVLDVSESRICQIHSKAVSKLRDRLERYEKG